MRLKMYLEKIKLQVFCAIVTKYLDSKAQFQALTEDCRYPILSLIENLLECVSQCIRKELAGIKTQKKIWEILNDR